MVEHGPNYGRRKGRKQGQLHPKTAGLDQVKKCGAVTRFGKKRRQNAAPKTLRSNQPAAINESVRSFEYGCATTPAAAAPSADILMRHPPASIPTFQMPRDELHCVSFVWH
jgi:hypothetical protein